MLTKICIGVSAGKVVSMVVLGKRKNAQPRKAVKADGKV